jgi:hypothetical protein
MTLEMAFKDLTARWERLAEELEEGLLWSVTETRPDEEHAMATHYIDAATDLIATAREGLAACRGAVDGAPNLGLAGRSLLRCQERYNALVALFDGEMASYRRVRRLRRFAREKGGAWRGWADRVGEAVGRCRQPMDDLNRALFGCWEEVTERVGISTVSVQATNIGQQITVPQAERIVESMT